MKAFRGTRAWLALVLSMLLVAAGATAGTASNGGGHGRATGSRRQDLGAALELRGVHRLRRGTGEPAAPRGGARRAQRDRLPQRRTVLVQRPQRRGVQGAAAQVRPQGTVQARRHERGDVGPAPGRREGSRPEVHGLRRAAKGELALALPEDGTLVFTSTAPEAATGSGRRLGRRLTFGVEGAGPADLTASDLAELEDGLRFVARIGDRSAEVPAPVFGSHLVEPLLAAIGGALALGLDLAECARGISRLRRTGLRGEVYRLRDGIVVYDDSYNASPAAVAAVLRYGAEQAAEEAAGSSPCSAACSSSAPRLGPTTRRRAGSPRRPGWICSSASATRPDGTPRPIRGIRSSTRTPRQPRTGSKAVCGPEITLW